MASDENSPAKIAIIEAWDSWVKTHPSDSKVAGGMIFFSYLQTERADLLLDFKAPGDQWQIVHSWLLSARRVTD